MYLKVVYEDRIVDVLNEDTDLVYVRYEPQTKTLLRCKADENPFGVLSSDSSVIYAFKETEGYPLVEIKEFDDTNEYELIKSQLEAARPVEYEEPAEPTEIVDPTIITDDDPISAGEALLIIFGGEE